MNSSGSTPIRDKRLTRRQREIFDWIRTRRVPPTVREIGRHFRIKSPNGVKCHIRSLERKGFVEVDPMKSRGIRVLVDDPLQELVDAARGMLVQDPNAADRLRAALKPYERCY